MRQRASQSEWRGTCLAAFVIRAFSSALSAERLSGYLILAFHAPEYPESHPNSHSWLCLCGYGDFRIIVYLKPSGFHLNVPALCPHSP